MLKDNHKILCNKIYKTFVNNIDLDLQTGFLEKVIRKDNASFLDNQINELNLSNNFVKGFIPNI